MCIRDRSTVAHEYFHTWNIKRIRPIELGPFDYDMENYTTELWVAEGLTSYYDNLLLLRSKILDTSEYFDFLSDDINSFEMKFGKNIQTLSESSFDSWIKYYRQNEESQNTIVSYYSKGSVIGLLLDLTLIIKSNGKLKLDIIDIRGRLVETLIDQKFVMGDYKIIWNAQSFPSGLYFVVLHFDHYIQTTKLVLIK